MAYIVTPVRLGSHLSCQPQSSGSSSKRISHSRTEKYRPPLGFAKTFSSAHHAIRTRYGFWALRV